MLEGTETDDAIRTALENFPMTERRRRYHLAYAHHRVEAARRAGLTEAEIFVGNFDDQTMVRIYVRENATQRNNKATAIRTGAPLQLFMCIHNWYSTPRAHESAPAS